MNKTNEVTSMVSQIKEDKPMTTTRNIKNSYHEENLANQQFDVTLLEAELLETVELQLAAEENLKKIIVMTLDFLLLEFINLSALEKEINSFKLNSTDYDSEESNNDILTVDENMKNSIYKSELFLKELCNSLNFNIEDNLKNCNKLEIARHLLLHFCGSQEQSPNLLTDNVTDNESEKNNGLQMNPFADTPYAKATNTPKNYAKSLKSDNMASKRPTLATDDGTSPYLVIGPKGTKVSRKAWDNINWNLSGPAITRKILMDIFDRDTLAFHTLTGKPSPAFTDFNMPEKSQLDPDKVNDVIYFMTQHFAMTSREVRSAITTKCADENKMYRLRKGQRATYPKKI